MTSPCDYFDTWRCRSCTLIERTYQDQLQHKHAFLAQLCKEMKGIAAPCELIPSAPAMGSRNKAKFAVAGSLHSPILGFPSTAGEVTETLDCPLHVPILNTIARRAKQLISELGIPPYSITARNGELKYILLRVSESTNQIIFRAVLRSHTCIAMIEKLWSRLVNEFAQIVVGSVNIQPEPKAVVEGREEIIFSDRKFAEERYGAHLLHFSPQTFSQVTSNVAAKLYHTAGEWIEAVKPRAMLDLYCGAGAFSFFASRAATIIRGVEESPSAIEDARRAANLQAVTHLSFDCSDVRRFLANHRERYDLVLINPPRRGVEPEVITYIKDTAPKTVIYSSCNPETLVRDLKELSSLYTVEQIQPFDMFPQTKHMEVLVKMSLRSFSRTKEAI